MRTLIAAALLVSAVAAQVRPPETAADPVTEKMHGTEVVDPYRWLEGSDAPEIEGVDADLDARVSKWTDAQNAYTRSILDNLPGRAALEKRLRELLEVGEVGQPQMSGPRYFFTRRARGQAQRVLLVREKLRGEERVLVDPNRLDDEGLVTMSWFTPNHQGTLVAFGLYRSGDENSTLYLVDVASGEWLAEEIPGKVGSVHWMPDGRGFFYRRLADVENPYSAQIKFHRVGRHHRQDPVLFEQYKEGPLATTWGPGFNIGWDGRWMVLYYWTSTSSNDMWIVDLDRWFRTGEFVRRDVVVGEKAKSFGLVVGETLFLHTDLDAPNGRIAGVDLNDPARERWREVVAERPDAVLEDVSVARGMLAVTYGKSASTRIERFTFGGRALGELKLPGLGTARLATAPDRTEAFLSYTSFNEPSTIYHVDLAGEECTVWERPDVPVDPESIVVEQVWYPSRDGTKISMFLVHRRDLARNGKNPTILYGYGGFNISITPSFNATMFPWFERGGVYALANLRGGGEYGGEWHKAGRLGNKQNVFDDYIAAAEWLIDNDYTTSDRLGAYGGSNGGLLTAAAVTQRPDLFSAVVSAVPLLDMLRYQHFLMARYWVPEYGSSEDAEQFAWLKAYSPYHHVEEGVKYPATFFTAGEHDARVHALHARKMAALMQARTASDPAEEPVLLWVEREGGHGAGKPLHLRVRAAADLRSFFMWQLGMTDTPN